MRRIVWATGRWVRGAPVSYLWLALLLVTSAVQHLSSPERVESILWSRSTNLHNLREHPVRVMIASLGWVDGSWWFPYLFGFTLILAVVEHWLGSLRMVVVGLSGHVLATLISQGILAILLANDAADTSRTQDIDIGVSYFLVAVAGILTYRIPRRWRPVWVLGWAALLIGPIIVDPVDVTALGHGASLLIGLALFPLTRGRRPRRSDWDPRSYWRVAGLSPMVRHRNS